MSPFAVRSGLHSVLLFGDKAPQGWPYTKGEIIIGNNVWLGDNVCVLPGVTIGDNVIVGANSVVTKDIETNTVAAGVPAKEIKN